MQRLFDLSPYHSPVARDHARMVYGATLLLAFLYTIFTLIPAEGKNTWQVAVENPRWAVQLAVFYGAMIVTFWALRKGNLERRCKMVFMRRLMAFR
jgi:hypothetical protein